MAATNANVCTMVKPMLPSADSAPAAATMKAEFTILFAATVRAVSVPRSRHRHAAKTVAPVNKGQVQATPRSSALYQAFGRG